MENKKLFFEQLISLLDTYTGRDKAIRTIYCSLALISTRIRDREKGEKLAAFAKQLSRARLVYRLFSQPSLIFSAIKIPQNWHNSTDKIETFFNTSTTLLYLFCGWTETIGWLSEAKILGRNSAKFFQLSLHLWVFALLTSITRCIRQIFIKIIQRKFFQIKDEFILSIALSADFIAAVNSLPKGILWAGKLNSSQNSLIFLIASIVGIYRLWK